MTRKMSSIWAGLRRACPPTMTRRAAGRLVWGMVRVKDPVAVGAPMGMSAERAATGPPPAAVSAPPPPGALVTGLRTSAEGALAEGPKVADMAMPERAEARVLDMGWLKTMKRVT